ncbi:hypothetical protein VTI74DRAFT_478 [Chaetomium olivicolor]
MSDELEVGKVPNWREMPAVMDGWPNFRPHRPVDIMPAIREEEEHDNSMPGGELSGAALRSASSSVYITDSTSMAKPVNNSTKVDAETDRAPIALTTLTPESRTSEDNFADADNTTTDESKFVKGFPLVCLMTGLMLAQLLVSLDRTIISTVSGGHLLAIMYVLC